MANLPCSNSKNITCNFSNSSWDEKKQNVSNEVNLIIAIIFNSITCPFTFLLNVLVIMAVKKRTSLQSNANILLACLAATDALTGLTTQPLFILWRTFLLTGINDATVSELNKACFLILATCSCLQLMAVVCERLVAIKFTFYYPYIVTKPNIKLVVIVCWIYSIFYLIFKQIINPGVVIQFLLIGPVFASCIVFVSFSHVILYHETLRHQKMMKTQQLPQEEVERFLKENKALKTTVLVVCAVVLCLLPILFGLVLASLGVLVVSVSVGSVFRTFIMLNSLLNPLIYCWRQEEMGRFVFRSSTQRVHPVN